MSLASFQAASMPILKADTALEKSLLFSYHLGNMAYKSQGMSELIVSSHSLLLPSEDTLLRTML